MFNQVSKTQVVNLRKEGYDIYIGRPRHGNPWGFGNPFVVGIDGQRGKCVDLFREWLLTGENFGCFGATEDRRQWILNNLEELRGKKLGCFCSPNKCHGDVLVEILNKSV